MSVYSILDKLQNRQHGLPAEYAERMIHPIPKAEVVNRREFVLERCKDKTVLDLGCAGTNGKGEFHAQIAEVATKAYGIDSQNCEHLEDVATLNIDKPIEVWPWTTDGIELIVAGELLEHLSNPGICLDGLNGAYPNAELLITVPNAFSIGAFRSVRKGIECCNRDHVAWFSHRTLRTLVERHRYSVSDFKWYNGEVNVAEGLIFICHKATNGHA